MSNIKNVAIIGTGVIGTGWVIRCLAHGKKVRAYDFNLKHKKNLKKRQLIAKQYIKNFSNIKNMSHMPYSKNCSFFIFQIIIN